MNKIKLSLLEKVSYGLGDAGCNLVWQTAMLFLAYFYTDVYGLSPAHMGTMFLAVRFIDAITDPIMGSIVDRTRTKYGRYRPYILWMAIPFGIACTMVFYTPDLGPVGKIVYAYASYIFLTLMYTALNVPYCAMANSLTDDSNERTSLQSFRFALNTVGGLIVAFSALPLVSIIGNGDKQAGYFGAMAVISVIATVMFIMCFSFTKERFEEKATVTEKSNAFQDLKLLMKSSQWRILFSVNLVLLVAILIKNASTMYYVNTVLERPDLATALMVTGLLCAVVGALVSPYLFNRFEKSKAYSGLIIASGIISSGLFLVDSSNLAMIFFLTAAYGFVQMMTSPIIWAMMSDLADYERVRTGKALSGIVFSTNLFAIKVGIAVGGAFVGWALSWVGYRPDAELQSPEVVTFINLLFSVIPGVLMGVVALMLVPYKLDKKTMDGTQNTKQLETALN